MHTRPKTALAALAPVVCILGLALAASSQTPPPLPTGAAPPPPPPTAITLPPAQAQVPVPPAILQAALGATFDLQVATLGKQGLIDLDGTAGKLQLQLQALLNLKPGDTVTLQLNGRGPQLQFIITAINGQSPAALIRAAATQSAQAGSQAQGGVLLNLPPFTEGNSLTATLLRPASGFAAAVPGAGGQTPNGQLQQFQQNPLRFVTE